VDQSKVGLGGFFFPEVFKQAPKKTMTEFEAGNILRLEHSEWTFIDELFTFLLESKFLEDAERDYPNPRKKNEVPVWFLLAAQVTLRANGSNNYSKLSTLLKSGSVLTRVGFNIGSRSIGFNEKNKHPRKTAVHHDTVRKYFLSTPYDALKKWFLNRQVWFRNQKAFHKGGLFVLDQTRIVVPDNKNYEDAEYMPVDEHGHLIDGYSSMSMEQKSAIKKRLCYNLSILMHINSTQSTTHITSYSLDGGRTDEVTQIIPTVEPFIQQNPGVMKELIMDRGYVDAKSINWLKDRLIDVIVPLKKHMSIYNDAIRITEIQESEKISTWQLVDIDRNVKVRENGPSRVIKKVYGMAIKSPMDLWGKVKEPLHVSVFRNEKFYEDDTFKVSYWVLASTREYSCPDQLYSKYQMRVSIEELNRQQKISWKVHKFVSPQRNLIEAQIAFTFLTYNLIQLLLRKNECFELTRQFRETWQHNESLGKQAVVIYAKGTFMVMDLFDYSMKLVTFPEDVRKKLANLCDQLRQESHR